MGTNCYIVGDPATKDAVVVDPGAEPERVLAEANSLGVTLKAIWLTHAHFDHIGGVAGLVRELNLPVALHSLDGPLYRELGGAKWFGLSLEPGPEPTIALDDFINPRPGLKVGELNFEVRFAPGHTLGHVAFYNAANSLVLGGDVLFQNSIGRTDLPGGDYDILIASIHRELLTLPDPTIIYSGHGPATTIGAERQNNPFL
jgi:glyoxylase-like metal-dependent hydrolase (beta-lactamase superfamily II)